MSIASVAQSGVLVEIGGIPILLRTGDASFREMLQQRYEGFVSPGSVPDFELEIELHDSVESAVIDADADVEVKRRDGGWSLRRGDFTAAWKTSSGRGHVVQSRNPYAIDSVLRIVHTLILASRGGFLLHAASAIRGGRAFLFAGVSGAGKTTISRLAPRDVTLLTDEISYVRHNGAEYGACGTPFAGELAKLGHNVSAPVAGVFLLQKGLHHRVEPIEQSQAVGALLRNILFFAQDQDLVRLVFQSACDFVRAVPVHRLTFSPERDVWDLIASSQ